MTREEALEILDTIPTIGEQVDALEMAIEALEQERPEIIRCKNCRHDNNCEIQYSAQAGSKFFCGLAERRAEQ